MSKPFSARGFCLRCGGKSIREDRFQITSRGVAPVVFFRARQSVKKLGALRVVYFGNAYRIKGWTSVMAARELGVYTFVVRIGRVLT